MSISDLITSAGAGNITFTINEPAFFDASVKEYVVFDKIFPEGRLKLFRNNKNELIFVRVSEDYLRQARLALADLVAVGAQLIVSLSWGEEEDTLSVQVAVDKPAVTVKAVQID